METKEWRIQGDFLMSCNCDVWCPCVLSLGKANPTYTRCLSWWGIHCEKGYFGDLILDGLTTALMLETPGPLAEGGWTLGIYLDEKGSPETQEALKSIFLGQAGGPIGWFSIMIENYLGHKVVPITFETREEGWYLGVSKIIDGSVSPVIGVDKATPTMVSNAGYWAAPEVTVSKGTKSRIRDWGRNWDFSGQSAEYAKVDWKGP